MRGLDLPVRHVPLFDPMEAVSPWSVPVTRGTRLSYIGDRFFPRIVSRLVLAAWGVLGLATGRTFAANPIVQDKGLADPHGFVDGNRVYLFATHDFSPLNKGFVMKDWWVWSSTDLVNWAQESILRPEDTYLRRPYNDCWATFGVRRHDTFYWYFSAGHNNIGVVVADSARGPWRDPLGKPLVAQGLTPTQQRDPDILLDDDGKAYMIYGPSTTSSCV